MPWRLVLYLLRNIWGGVNRVGGKIMGDDPRLSSTMVSGDDASRTDSAAMGALCIHGSHRTDHIFVVVIVHDLVPRHILHNQVPKQRIFIVIHCLSAR